jgi:hypothetical protein
MKSFMSNMTHINNGKHRKIDCLLDLIIKQINDVNLDKNIEQQKML